MNRKRIVFLTGTRADFGKLKSLISITQQSKEYEVHLFVTGMHMNSLYGSTIDEIRKGGFDNIYSFINHDSIDNMDRTLAKTICLGSLIILSASKTFLKFLFSVVKYSKFKSRDL